MIGDVLSWGAVALGIYILASGAALALFALLARRAARGEEAGVPEEPVPDPSRAEIRAALDDTYRSLPGVVNTRLEAMACDQLRDLRRLDRQLQGYYVIEMDR